ncbi:MAG TPA: D-glycero-beta-D-manno-heptose 1-phosphate adenylyltransferase [Pirellulales bacterium]|nr:D-glycero-beta-D-manno-heptose 1-phosphate adenylyltransferase [Pirellulales bacterium]
MSDYDKGVCTPRLLEMVIEAARQAGVPVLVDPIRSRDYSRYRGATSMTPNRLEAELATGLKIVTERDAFAAADRLRRDLDLEFGIVTLDRDGMALVDASGQGAIFPTRPRAVYDITGAGDMALAMIGVSLAAGVGPADALRLGNIAAGLEVEKVGVAVIPRAEIRGRLLEEQAAAERERAASAPRSALRAPHLKVLPLDELSQRAAQHSAAGEKIVFTNGCFDLLHVGHISYLAEARALGDLLIVGLNSDSSVRRLKGPTRPVINERDRAAMLAALAAVDYVVIFDEPTPHHLLHNLQPDVLVKGGTYRPDEVVGHEVVEAYGGQVGVVGLVEGVSTTAILASLADRDGLKGPHFVPAAETTRTRKAS